MNLKYFVLSYRMCVCITLLFIVLVDVHKELIFWYKKFTSVSDLAKICEVYACTCSMLFDVCVCVCVQLDAFCQYG